MGDFKIVHFCLHAIASGLSDGCDPFEINFLNFPGEENIIVSTRVAPAIFLVHTEGTNGYANCENVEQSLQRMMMLIKPRIKHFLTMQ